jgi:hypothetical protein
MARVAGALSVTIDHLDDFFDVLISFLVDDLRENTKID